MRVFYGFTMTVNQNLEHLLFQFFFLQLTFGSRPVLPLMHLVYMFKDNTDIGIERSIGFSSTCWSACINITVISKLFLFIFLHFLVHIGNFFLLKYFGTRTLRSFFFNWVTVPCCFQPNSGEGRSRPASLGQGDPTILVDFLAGVVFHFHTGYYDWGQIKLFFLLYFFDLKRQPLFELIVKAFSLFAVLQL